MNISREEFSGLVSEIRVATDRYKALEADRNNFHTEVERLREVLDMIAKMPKDEPLFALSVIQSMAKEALSK